MLLTRTRPIRYPKDTMTLTDSIDYEWLEDENAYLHKYMDIVISEVYDPSKFWVQLKPKLCDLELLMDELQ